MLTITKRDQSTEPYSRNKIVTAIKKAFNATVGSNYAEEVIDNIVDNVVNVFKNLDNVAVEFVQDTVEKTLMKMGFVDVAKAYILYRQKRSEVRNQAQNGLKTGDIVKSYIDQTDWRVRENANAGFSYASLISHCASTVIANYVLDEVYPEAIANAHKEGDMHIHDLGCGIVGYCAGHSLRDLLLMGFQGVHGRAAAGPAKHFDSALLQLANFLCTLQTEWAGAQAVSSFDTLLAPFIRHDQLDYKEVEQRIQQFVFGLNVASRLGQCVPMTTKCLKADGTWVNGDELKIGDKIMVFDMNTGQIKTDTVTHITLKPYYGPLNLYEHNGKQFKVTPDHIMLYWEKDSDELMCKESKRLKVNQGNNKEYWIPAIDDPQAKDLTWHKDSVIKKNNCMSYVGNVWCPTTASETFIAKSEDGYVFITHNCPFTNITLDWTVPDDLKDHPVIIGGEPHEEWVYGDFKKEMDMINEAFLRVMARGDENKSIFTFPIPTYNITKEFDWDSPNTKLLFEVTGKYGIPYFQNFVNSELNPTDVRSMAFLGTQDIIHINKDGHVSKNEIRHLVENWISGATDNYQILMNGKFIKVIDMFEVPYTDYNTYVSITLENGYTQPFSKHHKCYIYRNGEFLEEESQNITKDDCFVISSKPWGINNEVGSYDAGKILGYYLAEGWHNSHSDTEIAFAINIKRDDIAQDIYAFFTRLGSQVDIDKQEDRNIFRVNVHGKQAVGFVDQYITGKTAKEKRLHYSLWNTSDSFRQGLYDGYYCTDGSSTEHNIAHTTNKELVQDLIILASSLGKVCKYRVNDKNTRSFKKDKSDKVHFTSYVLDEAKYNKVNDYYIVPVRNVEELYSRADKMYNFTVDSSDHLIELPNGVITHQCCRLSLNVRELKNKTGGLFGAAEKTGSIGVVTLNLPRLGYLYKTKEALLKALDDKMEIAKESLEIKRKLITRNMEAGLMPYSRIYLGNFNNHFSTIGLVGMNELCLNLLGKSIATPEGNALGIEILKHMREKLQEFQVKTGNMYNLESSPAEGTSYRLAKIDKAKYPDIITSGTDTPYYTNSSNLPVGHTSDIFEALDLQEALQCCYTGGTVFHAFLGECIDDPELVAKIVRTIFNKYRIPYLTISPTFSICPIHGYVPGAHSKCPCQISKVSKE